jgi:hypothetical protein
MPDTSYPACSIKRVRRGAAEIQVIRRSILEVLNSGFPMTLRQLFYKLVSQGVIAKTEAVREEVRTGRDAFTMS